jgi:hypothetical protein
MENTRSLEDDGAFSETAFDLHELSSEVDSIEIPIKEMHVWGRGTLCVDDETGHIYGTNIKVKYNAYNKRIIVECSLENGYKVIVNKYTINPQISSIDRLYVYGNVKVKFPARFMSRESEIQAEMPVVVDIYGTAQYDYLRVIATGGAMISMHLADLHVDILDMFAAEDSRILNFVNNNNNGDVTASVCDSARIQGVFTGTGTLKATHSGFIDVECNENTVIKLMDHTAIIKCRPIIKK